METAAWVAQLAAASTVAAVGSRAVVDWVAAARVAAVRAASAGLMADERAEASRAAAAPGATKAGMVSSIQSMPRSTPSSGYRCICAPMIQ